MRIGSFNLENLDDRPGLAPSLAERIPILRARLHRLDCDLLCLQEVNAQTVESQAPRRLRALERLIADITADGDAEEILPEGFPEFWTVFREAIAVND